ncbi:glycoside hydrolase family 7 protein [Apiospora aurea]|uniref:Glucanase n=1 Tax=Apiospora aurea TaxID=335848 RepID=A0ABR1PRY6_9PEZI
MLSKIAILASLVATGQSQLAGTEQEEVHPKLTWQKCTAPGSCSNVAGSIVVDANWRWAHGKGGYTNCYTGNTWNSEFCPDNEACAANCEIEGADYASTYGITTSGNAVSLKFVTPNSSGTNVGSRVYLLADDENYEMFTMNGNEIAFDVENGEIGCGLNGAVYFVSMDEDGGKARSPATRRAPSTEPATATRSAPGNAEGWKPSPDDANSGVGAMGPCCAEMDLWEANSMSFALTPHPCEDSGYVVCENESCGGTYSEDRYAGQCDPDGCDLNPYRHGNTDFYGKGKTVDTSKKFTVVTQFHGSGSSLESISQYFIQDGARIDVPESKVVDGGSVIDEAFCDASKELFADNLRYQELGGLAQMGDATGKGMVLTISIWDDLYSNMLWLDGVVYPTDRNPGDPGVARGECPLEGSEPATVRQKFANAKVTYSNIKFGPIGSTYDV